MRMILASFRYAKNLRNAGAGRTRRGPRLVAIIGRKARRYAIFEAWGRSSSAGPLFAQKWEGRGDPRGTRKSFLQHAFWCKRASRSNPAPRRRKAAPPRARPAPRAGDGCPRASTTSTPTVHAPRVRYALWRMARSLLAICVVGYCRVLATLRYCIKEQRNSPCVGRSTYETIRPVSIRPMTRRSLHVHCHCPEPERGS